MAALGVEVEFGRDVCLLQGLEVDEGILFVDRVVFGLKDEAGWGGGVGDGLGSDGLFIGPVD